MKNKNMSRFCQIFAILGVFCAVSAEAQVIGINFIGNNVAVTGTAGAPGYTQANWNEAGYYGPGENNSSFGITLPLVDSTGGSTSAILTDFHATTAFAFGSNTTSDDQLMGGSLDTNITDINAGGSEVGGITVTNVPYSVYDVIIYSTVWFDTATQVRIGDTSIFMRTGGVDFTTDGNIYTEVPSTANTDPGTVGNYTIFTGLSSSTLQIDFAATSLGQGFISGIQIVAVPEPGPASLVVGSGLVFALFRSRKWFNSCLRQASIA